MVVAGWGGFRERIGGMRVALTSPYRLLVGGRRAGVAPARRSSPRPPIVHDLPRGASRRRGTHPPAAPPAGAFVGTRPTILFVGYFAVVTFGYINDNRPPLRFADNEFVNLQGKWDTAWYLSIVIDGYRYQTQRHDAAAEHRVLPGAADAMRVAGRLFGGASPAFLWGGTLVVLAAFFWSLVYLYRLARELLDDEDAARWAVWLIARLSLRALLQRALHRVVLPARRRPARSITSGGASSCKARGWGLLVGLTRPNGCFLSIPLALIALAPWLPAWLTGGASAARDDRVRPSAHRARCDSDAGAGGGARHRRADLFGVHLESHRRSAGVGRRARRVGPAVQRPGAAR